ncbi:MCE family protein [Nonomuraea sp. NBC_01738]|uniref:MCE family protein n=1 Tax=Nonomuraea sp. NBC_01738 TaxID=2976003 RepID=UPI002E0F8AA6|nr:MCE family protein [Nonomuraea sp. NBC_01738]
MTTLSAALKLTLFGLVTSLCVAVLAITIAGVRLGPTTTYHATFTDVTSLRTGDDVRVAGVRVGRVEEIVLAGDRADVEFSVRERTRLPSGVIAAIRWRNLVGDRYLALSTGRGGPGALPPGARITDTRPALDVTALFNGFRPLLKAIDPADVNKLSWQLVQVLQGEGGTIDSLLGHVASLTGALADRDAVIGRVVDNLTTVLGEIAGREDQYGRLITDLGALIHGLADDREAIGDSLATLDRLTGITQGLLTRARPDLKADADHMGNLFETLNDERELLDTTIKDVPLRLNQLTRAVSYGSWFNFYLCSLKVKSGALTTPAITNEGARCR